MYVTFVVAYTIYIYLKYTFKFNFKLILPQMWIELNVNVALNKSNVAAGAYQVQ